MPCVGWRWHVLRLPVPGVWEAVEVYRRPCIPGIPYTATHLSFSMSPIQFRFLLSFLPILSYTLALSPIQLRFLLSFFPILSYTLVLPLLLSPLSYLILEDRLKKRRQSTDFRKNSPNSRQNREEST